MGVVSTSSAIDGGATAAALAAAALAMRLLRTARRSLWCSFTSSWISFTPRTTALASALSCTLKRPPPRGALIGTAARERSPTMLPSPSPSPSPIPSPSPPSRTTPLVAVDATSDTAAAAERSVAERSVCAPPRRRVRAAMESARMAPDSTAPLRMADGVSASSSLLFTPDDTTRGDRFIASASARTRSWRSAGSGTTSCLDTRRWGVQSEAA